MWPLFLAAALAFDGDAVILGNSYVYTNDLPATLQGLLAEGGRATAVTGLTAGGLKLPDHLARIEGDAVAWQEAFDGDRWGAVVLQDQSQIPGFPDGSPDKAASLAALGPLDAHAADAGAETWLLLTWGRRDGDSGNPTLYPDFTAMQDRLDEGYAAYRAAIDTAERPAWIAPVGTAFRTVHADITAAGADPLATDSAFYGLYVADGSHPSPAGTALAAYVIYAAWTGCDPEALAPVVDEATAGPLRAVARRVVLDGEDGALSLAYPWASAPCGVVPPAEDSGRDDTSTDDDTSAEAGGEAGGCGCGTAVPIGWLPASAAGLLALRRRRTSVPAARRTGAGELSAHPR